MIEIDKSLFIQLFNFLLMMIVLNYLLYRPLRNMIKQRKEKFEGLESDIDRFHGQAAEQESNIEAQLVEARRDGFTKKDELKSAGNEEEKVILNQAAQEGEAALEKLKAQITEEIGVARESLRSELEVFSRELAQKVLGRNLS